MVAKSTSTQRDAAAAVALSVQPARRKARPYVLNFGTHQGMALDDVPPSYVRWLASDEFTPNAKTQAAKKAATAWVANQRTTTKLTGNLTGRVKQLMADDRDALLQRVGGPFVFTTTSAELPATTVVELRRLHAADAKTFGCAMDYLLRRVLAEANGLDGIRDHRAEACLSVCDDTEDDPDVLAWVDTVWRHGNVVPYHNLRRSYDDFRAVRKTATRDAVHSVCVTSYAHSFFFNEQPAPGFIDLFSRAVQPADVDAIAASITKAVPRSAALMLNPSLSVSGMGADADVIAGDVLVDFKCSKADAADTAMLQLLGYAALARRRAITIRTVRVYNPVLNTVASCEIAGWQEEFGESLLSALNVNV